MATFPEIFNGLNLIGPMSVRTKFEVRSFTRSRDNAGTSKIGQFLDTPIVNGIVPAMNPNITLNPAGKLGNERSQTFVVLLRLSLSSQNDRHVLTIYCRVRGDRESSGRG